MVGKIIKCISIAGLLFFVVYNSVYFKKLDKVKAETAATKFDATTYAGNYYNKLLPLLENSIDITTLRSLLNTDPAKAFDTYSHALGIGNIKYFLTQGKGKVTEVNESDITVVIADSSTTVIKIATEYIFGNAVRDASGLIDLKEFTKTADLNNVSAEINKKIREEILPAVKAKIKVGDSVAFAGAIELNRQHLDTRNMEVIPISLKIID